MLLLVWEEAGSSSVSVSSVAALVSSPVAEPVGGGGERMMMSSVALLVVAGFGAKKRSSDFWPLPSVDCCELGFVFVFFFVGFEDREDGARRFSEVAVGRLVDSG